MAPLGVHSRRPPGSWRGWSLSGRRLPLVPGERLSMAATATGRGVIRLLTPRLMALRNHFAYLFVTFGCTGSSALWGFSLAAARRLLIAAAPVGVQRGLRSCDTWAECARLPGSGSRAQELWCPGSAVLGRWDLPDQGSNPCILHWQVDSLPLGRQGSTRIDELGNFYTVFTGYTSFIVITKYWLYSPCCIIQPCSLSYTQYFLPPVSVHMGPGL